MTNFVIDRKKYGELNWGIEDKKSYREFSTVDEAIEWGNAYYKDWSTSYQKVFSLTRGFVKGSLACIPIESYCGYAFKKINQFLRFDIDNEFNTYRELADILAIALCSAPRIPFKLVVYRLVCDEFIEELISRNRDLSLPAQEKGFMSTSLLPDIVNAEEKYANKRNLLKIYVGEESIGIYVNSVALRSEQEILFPPNGHLALIEYPHFDTSCAKTIYECKLINFYN